MNFFDNYADHFDSREYNPQAKKRSSAKRRWRDIEKLIDNRQLSKAMNSDVYRYFENLEQR